MDVTSEVAKTDLDFLVDIFLSIPEYIKIYDEVHDSLSKMVLHHRRTILTKLSRGLASLLSQLDTQGKMTCNELNTAVGYENNTVKHLTKKKGPSPESMSDHLYALRSAAYVICLSLMTACDSSEDWLEQAILRSAEVLSAVESVDSASKSHASRMFITTVFPTYVVAIWSPSEKYRALALNRLQHSTPIL